MRINNPDWYPCYLNPDFGEILELAKSGWDTVRIMAEQPHGTIIDETNGDIVIASGHGNTHHSVVVTYARFKGLIRKEETRPDGSIRYRFDYRMPSFTPYILYHENRIALMNLCDCSGPENARYDEWSRYFYTGHVELLKDLIRESDLAL